MNWLANIAERLKARPRAWWQAFSVSSDDERVVIREKRRKKVMTETFCWASVRRVCFKDRGLASDVFFVFTSERPEALMIPTEAEGGNAFWVALRERGLFPDAISAAAVRSTDGGLYCWPREDVPGASANKRLETDAKRARGSRVRR